VAYVAAFVLTAVASVAMPMAVAVARVGWDQAKLPEAINAFVFSGPGMMAVALAVAVTLSGVTLVAVRLEKQRPVARLRLGPSAASPLGMAAALTGLIGISLSTATASESLGLTGGVMDTMAKALASPTPAGLVASVLALGVAPAVAEETFFRGLLQRRLVARWGRWPGIAMASAGFGLIHLDARQGSLAFLAGLFLGWVVERLGGLRPTIAAHALNNSLFLLLAATGSTEEAGRSTKFAVIAGGTAMALASIAVLRWPAALRASTPAS
jgi:membrane protease YdiL (CAAX protease family)